MVWFIFYIQMCCFFLQRGWKIEALIGAVSFSRRSIVNFEMLFSSLTLFLIRQTRWTRCSLPMGGRRDKKRIFFWRAFVHIWGRFARFVMPRCIIDTVWMEQRTPWERYIKHNNRLHVKTDKCKCMKCVKVCSCHPRQTLVLKTTFET